MVSRNTIKTAETQIGMGLLVSKFDVVVVGGGVTGITLALLLARMSAGSLSICLVDISSRSRKPNPRTSSISIGPKNMLASVGAWPTQAMLVSPVRRIDVFDAATTNEVFTPDLTFQCGENEDPMAWIVRHSDLEAHLSRIAEGASIDLAEGRVVSLRNEGPTAKIELHTGDFLQARLVVAADGVNSHLRELVKAPCVEWSYDRSAIVATLAHQRSHADSAIQVFYPDGPFATLPLNGDRSSLVWTLTSEKANQLSLCNVTELTSEIERASASLLGSLELEGDVAKFALGYKHVRNLCYERLVFIGDAARRVHPLAGQGLNLGLRDAAALAECVIETARLGLDIGARKTLVDYSHRRNLDSVVSSSSFDILHRIFSWDASALRAARKTGIKIFQNSEQIKALLIREAAGLAGNYPDGFKSKKV